MKLRHNVVYFRSYDIDSLMGYVNKWLENARFEEIVSTHYNAVALIDSDEIEYTYLIHYKHY